MIQLLVSVLLAVDGGETPPAWNVRTIEQVRVEFPSEFVTENKWDTGGSTQFTSLITGPNEVFIVNVRAEKSEGLEALKLDHPSPPWTFWKTEQTTVCGKKAQKVVVTKAAQDIQCVETVDGTGGGPMHSPARKLVALIFPHRGLVVRVTMESESDKPNVHDAFFARVTKSIRCD
ncbi:MAG: hypothetical protein JNM17_39820 [Archangium sp.]|nr:hypothetical protein [Archangium sp.]